MQPRLTGDRSGALVNAARRAAQNEKEQDPMTTIGEVCNREVVFTARDTPIAVAARLMRQYHVGTVVIVDQMNGGKQMRNVWSIPYPSARERQFGKHPSQKPLSIITRLMLIGTSERDTVLDCFSGSGTTGVVAQSFNRRWVMIEANPEYNEIAENRLAKVNVPLPPELLEHSHANPIGES